MNKRLTFMQKVRFNVELIWTNLVLTIYVTLEKCHLISEKTSTRKIHLHFSKIVRSARKIGIELNEPRIAMIEHGFKELES